jgi:hypothetical protein
MDFDGASNFEMVSTMNNAFNNPKGDPFNIDWNRVRSQTKNIFDEYCEALKALGMAEWLIETIKTAHKLAIEQGFKEQPNLDKYRDALCDIHVFAYGAHHFLGYNADMDMQAVVGGVMTRFVKDQADLEATIDMHAKKGVHHVYTEGTFPTMILKSGSDQPDAPKGKFLKSASYKEATFYQLVPDTQKLVGTGLTGLFDPLV